MALVLFPKMGYNSIGSHKEARRKKIMSNQEEWDIIELEGDDGEPIRLCVERDEYVLLSDACDVEDEADISRYVMKVQPMEGEGNEDMEEFVPVDEDLMDQLIQVVEATFDTEDEDE
jgi:hypothetical protein